MSSVDTNIVARFLLGDDPIQSPIAERVVAEGVFITLTVLLETNWLLSSRYGFSKSDIIGMFQILRRQQSVTVEGGEWLDWMFQQFGKGSDFADLIHLVASRHRQQFFTFDKPFSRKIRAGAPASVVVPA